jgi:hypothetical protein
MNIIKLEPPEGRCISGMWQNEGCDGWGTDDGHSFRVGQLPGPGGFYDAIEVVKDGKRVAIVPAYMAVITYAEEKP